ncbi:unnamed protein product [Mytilus edulis]|uniref:Uncharacterized protein n=1 Tax=Mytilus edulis TaxID=6550 RepID=A0A8S3PV62_MYTED|nr:unnamed protein product [Mytilus edulis]
MKPVYNTLVEELEKIVNKPAILLDNDYQIFTVDNLKISDFCQGVLKPLDENSIVLQCISKMASGILGKCQNFFKDYLPEGKYHCPSENTKKETLTCPSNNIALERMMGQLDRQKTISPNINTSTINTKLMMKITKWKGWVGKMKKTKFKLWQKQDKSPKY